MTYDNTGHPQGGGGAPQGNPNGAPYQPHSPGAQSNGFQPHVPFNPHQQHAPQHAPQPYQQFAPQQAPAPQAQPPVPGQTFTYDVAGNLVPVVQPVMQPGMPQGTPAQEPQVQVASEARAQVEGFLKTAGIPAAQVEQEIAVLGTVSDATKKALVDKHGAATANLLMNQINSITSAEQASAQALQQMQFDMVGEAFKGVTEQTPQESWNELIMWARQNIDANTRTQLNQMMKAGDFQAKQAIEYMINTLKTSQGMEQHGQLLNGDNTNGGSNTNGDLTASAYSRELEKVVAKHGYESPERKALDARRMASMQRGI